MWYCHVAQTVALLDQQQHFATEKEMKLKLTLTLIIISCQNTNNKEFDSGRLSCDCKRWEIHNKSRDVINEQVTTGQFEATEKPNNTYTIT